MKKKVTTKSTHSESVSPKSKDTKSIFQGGTERETGGKTISMEASTSLLATPPSDSKSAGKNENTQSTSLKKESVKTSQTLSQTPVDTEGSKATLPPDVSSKSDENHTGGVNLSKHLSLHLNTSNISSMNSEKDTTKVVDPDDLPLICLVATLNPRTNTSQISGNSVESPKGSLTPISTKLPNDTPSSVSTTPDQSAPVTPTFPCSSTSLIKVKFLLLFLKYIYARLRCFRVKISENV